MAVCIVPTLSWWWCMLVEYIHAHACITVIHKVIHLPSGTEELGSCDLLSQILLDFQN